MLYTVTTITPEGVKVSYSGRLRHEAIRLYEREERLQIGRDGVVILTQHDQARTILRKSDDIVVNVCSRCHEPIPGDFVPAKDALTSADVCDSCCRAQRHARRSA